MSSLDRIRGLLKDRQVKPGALGTTKLSVCLDVSLVDDLRELESDLEAAEAARNIAAAAAPKNDLRGGQTAPTTLTPELDAEIAQHQAAVEAKKSEIRAASITVKFRSLGSDRYHQVVSSYDEPDGTDRQELLDALCSECLYEVTSDGEKIDLSWEEIRPNLSPGERQDANDKILILNKRRVDVPFS